MFGLFHGFLTIFSVGVNKINQTIENNKNKDEAKKRGDETYSGSSGGQYLIVNDRQVYKTYEDGHEVLKDIYNGQIYHDYTAERERKIKEQSKERGDTVYRVDKSRTSSLISDPMVSSYYIDFETNHPVGQLLINNHRFYMDLETGYLLRLTDDMIKIMKTDVYKSYPRTMEPSQIISLFNARQEQLKQCSEYRKDKSWMKYIFLLEAYKTPSKKHEINVNGELNNNVFHMLGEYDLNTGKHV